MEQQEQALLEGATVCCETLSRLLCQDHQRANLAPGTGSHRIDILTAWGPRLDYLSAASPSPCHQTVIISYTRPFFGALILHLSENIGTIACRARYWETRRDRPDGDIGRDWAGKAADCRAAGAD